MTNPRLEEIARRQMGPKAPLPIHDKMEGHKRIIYNSGAAQIILTTSDYNALEVVLKKAGRDPDNYLSSEKGIIEEGRVVKLFLSYSKHQGYSKMRSIPEEIGNLDKLKVLYLAWNELTTLPESFRKLKSLQILGLGENLFASLPESIGMLTELNHLVLLGNQLKALPEFLANLPKLNRILVDGREIIPESIKGNVEKWR